MAFSVTTCCDMCGKEMSFETEDIASLGNSVIVCSDECEDGFILLEKLLEENEV